MSEASPHQSRLSVAIHRSSRTVEHSLDLRVRIVVELNAIRCCFMTIESNLNCVTHVQVGHQRLRASHRRGTAHQSVFINDRHIHVLPTIEDASCLIQAHIEEVPALHCDLSVAVRGTTRWLKTDHFRRFVIQEVQGR